MGNYSIVIEGVGAHGNEAHPGDAESIAARAVRDLIEHAHNVTHAMVHAGGGCVELQHVRELGAITRSDGRPGALAFHGDALAAHLRATFHGAGLNPAKEATPWQWGDLEESERAAWRAVAEAARR